MALWPSLAPGETLVSKAEADQIFSLNLQGWESFVQQMPVPEGWEARRLPHDTGTSWMGIDSAGGFSLLVQPLFDDQSSPPLMLVIGNYYPVGYLNDFNDQVRGDMEKATQNDLGTDYAVRVQFSRLPEADLLELLITKVQ